MSINLQQVSCEDIVDVVQPGDHGGQAMQILDHHWVVESGGISSVLPCLDYNCFFNILTLNLFNHTCEA